jgi:hypothetical protein
MAHDSTATSAPHVTATLAARSVEPPESWSGNCTSSFVLVYRERRVEKMNTKLLVSLGSTLAATRLAQGISHLEADDILGLIGLARRRNHLLENLALVGLGAIAGAGAALLLAPASGLETRERMAFELGRVKEKTVDALKDAKRQAPAMLQHMKDNISKNEAVSSYNT